MIELHSYFRKQNALVSDFHGKKTLVAFCLDKDADDYCRKQIVCDHIIYSEYYSIENDLVLGCDIVKCVAATASLPRETVRAAFSNLNPINRLHNLLKEWMIICLFVKMHRVGCDKSYSIFSTVHSKSDFVLDCNLFSICKKNLHTRSAFTVNGFNRCWAKIVNIIETAIATGNSENLFPGKWYFTAIKEVVTKHCSGVDFDKDSFESGLRRAMLAQLDFTAPWAEDYFNRILQLSKRL